MNLAKKAPRPSAATWAMSTRAREACAAVCQAHAVPLSWVLSPSRLRVVVRARWACWAAVYALRRGDGSRAYSTTAIGLMFGFDHSSVVIGLRRHREILAAATQDTSAMAKAAA